MSNTSEDLDTLQGFQTFFQASPDLQAAIPGGMRRGRLKKGVDEPPGKPGSIQCYAIIECVQGPKENVYSAPVVTGAGYKDYRKVTLTVLGQEPDVSNALKAMRAAFEWQPKGSTPLAIPNTDHLVSVMTLPDSTKLEQDETGKKGYDIWRGSEQYQVCTGRKVP